VTRRSIPDFTPDGLRKRLRDLERNVADLYRVRESPPSYVEQSGGATETFTNGSADIANGSSSVNVSHGLGGTPTSVLLTPWLNEDVWVSARSATTFTISRAGTTGNLQIDWLAAGVVSASTAYRDLIVAEPTLVGAWPLELGSNTNGTFVPDASANANDGALVVSAQPPTVGVASIIPSVGTTCTTWNGTSGQGDRAEVPGTGTGLGSISSMTVEAWIAMSSSGTHVVMARDDESGTGRLFQFRVKAGQVELLLWNSNGTLATFAGGSSLNDGATHHIAVTYNSGTAQVYVDGAAVTTSGSLTGTIRTGTVDLAIANREVSTFSMFAGTLQWPAIYNSALSATAIFDHYNAGIS